MNRIGSLVARGSNAVGGMPRAGASRQGLELSGMKLFSLALVSAAGLAATGGAVSDLAKWDPRMAADRAVVDTNGVKWIDGRYLPIERRWTLGDAPEFYARLPNTLTTSVREYPTWRKTSEAEMPDRISPSIWAIASASHVGAPG